MSNAYFFVKYFLINLLSIDLYGISSVLLITLPLRIYRTSVSNVFSKKYFLMNLFSPYLYETSSVLLFTLPLGIFLTSLSTILPDLYHKFFSPYLYRTFVKYPLLNLFSAYYFRTFSVLST